MRARYPDLPAGASTWLREHAVLAVDLAQLHLEREALRVTKRERSRLRRQAVILRSQLLTLERRLEELSRTNGHGRLPSVAELVRAHERPA